MVRNPQTTDLRSGEPKVAGDFGLRYLVEVLFRRKRMLLIPIVCTPLLAILLSYTITPSYMSTTTIILGKAEILNPLVRYDTSVQMAEYDRLGLFQKIVYSRPLIEDVIHKLKLDRQLKSEAQLEWLVNDVRKSIHMMALTADSFQIGCSAANPRLAKDLVETVSELFIAKSLAGSRLEATVAVTFIQQQVDHYRQELEQGEAQLQAFKLAHIDTLRQMSSMNQLIEDYNTKRVSAELALHQDQLIEQLLSARLRGEKPMVVSQALFVQNTPYQTQYQELAIKLGNLLATRNTNHPDVLKLQREMDYIVALLDKEKEKRDAKETQEVRSPVYQEVLSRLEDTRIKIKVEQDEIEQYSRMGEGLKTRIADVPAVEVVVSRLEQEVRLNREIYDTLKIKLEHARVSREVEIAQQTNRFIIIDPPTVPLVRFKPIRRTFMVGGMAGGLMLGLLLVFVLEFGDPRLLRPSELTQRFRKPVLGGIPKLYAFEDRVTPVLKRLPHRAEDLFARVFCAKRFAMPAGFPSDFRLSQRLIQTPASADDPGLDRLRDFTERVRRIGVGVRASYAPPDGLVIAIASTAPGEGKSLLAFNLGAVLANDLRKPVLLVDAHVRHPTLSGWLARPGERGLLNVLSGGCPLAEAVCGTGFTGLSLPPLGSSTDDSGTLFQSDALPRMLEACRERYAMTLVEVPDLIGATPGMILAPHVDGILWVARLYATQVHSIDSAMQKINPEKLVGFVVNRMEYWIPDWLYRWV